MANDVKVVYHERDGKPTFAVTGAYGGPSPEGNSVVAHLYVDHSTVPTMSIHTIEAGVVKLNEGEVIRRADLTREIQATLVMAPESAMRLGRFLIERAQQAIAARDQQNAEGE